MKFLELNKKRHAVKHFNDKLVDYKDLRTAIEIATLSPSANNLQPSRKIARIGVKSLSNDQLSYYMETLPARFAAFDDQHKGEYLALNAGIVAMNFVLALTDQGLASNMILGFDKSVTNDILNIDHRFQPELLITVGYSDETLEPSYRLPVDDLIERR